MSDESRSSLARAQAELVRALTAQGGPLPDFDPARIALATKMLQAKRARGVARSWPKLVESLGPKFGEYFSTYAAAHPMLQADAVTDGLRFLRFLNDLHQLPDEACLEWLEFQARRRCIAVARLPVQKRLAICFRAPWGRRIRQIRI